ncbi:MAG: hypothetical protein KJ893_09530 [Candidatus Omnitrophica bacterium]|nr:hypothetical protein [Candidatus Omnitrophota bacterium]MBU4478474.1 hypothetical protein [Candidatus Omnitrophota bacterium]MCG2703775.1 hypothetical protein [Candidatus Omnitrophota bacterium]
MRELRRTARLAEAPRGRIAASAAKPSAARRVSFTKSSRKKALFRGAVFLPPSAGQVRFVSFVDTKEMKAWGEGGLAKPPTHTQLASVNRTAHQLL